jgi:hypothetical protein
MSELLMTIIQLLMGFGIWLGMKQIEDRWTREKKIQDKLWLLQDQVNRIAAYLDEQVNQKK